MVHQTQRRLQEGVEDGVDARVKRAVDHYVEAERTQVSDTRSTKPTRYNFRVSHWLGCGRKMKTAIVPGRKRREGGGETKSHRDRFM